MPIRNSRLTWTLAWIVLILTGAPVVHAATPSINSLGESLGEESESDEVSLSSEARYELNSLLNASYRAPAVLGAATQEPSGENASLYPNPFDPNSPRPGEASAD